MRSIAKKHRRWPRNDYDGTHRCLPDHQEGNVLVALVIMMVVIATLGVAMVSLIAPSSTSQVGASHSMKAQYLAEAGARYILPRFSGLADGEHVFKFSNGRTFFIINKINGNTFTSTGVIGEGSEALESRVTLRYNWNSSPFDYAMFADESITLSGQAYTDSYNSANGDWNYEGEFSNGDIGTITSGNSIQTSGQITIHGDTFTGVGKDMTPVTLPGGGTPLSNIRNLPGGSGTYSLSGISLSGQTVVDVTGDVVLYVDGDISISGQAKIRVQEGGSLTVYANGNINLSGQGITNDGGKPRDVIIYGTEETESINISGQALLYGAIYAPEANLNYSGQAEIFGSLIMNRITMSGQAHIHFDEDLRDLGGTGGRITQTFIDTES